MTRQMTATEVKAKLLALLDDVERGEEIELTRHGHTVARLAPARGPPALKRRFAGVVMSGDRAGLVACHPGRPGATTQAPAKDRHLVGDGDGAAGSCHLSPSLHLPSPPLGSGWEPRPVSWRSACDTRLFALQFKAFSLGLT